MMNTLLWGIFLTLVILIFLDPWDPRAPKDTRLSS